jgi:HK97 family phage major capsid protein
LDLFKRKAVSTEYIKYREENVVTRDAKFVVACATSTHLTKKSYVVRTVELAKIRDIMDACIDMLDDYAFVESELKALVNESIKLKAEFELLLGSGSGATDMLSIDTISSEFNPANALGNFSTASGTPFQDANLEQLVDAMSAQISIFGQENAWMANTVVMNFRDFVNYRNLKDSDGNKLVHTLSDAMPTIAGMNVVTSPIVSANTLFVFDTNQGEILDRQSITLKTSFENNDNIEHETVTFVGVERLQFHVPIIKRDAFMKCSDIATAITAITKA